MTIPDEVRRLASLGPAIAKSRNPAWLRDVLRTYERVRRETVIECPGCETHETLERVRYAVEERLAELGAPDA